MPKINTSKALVWEVDCQQVDAHRYSVRLRLPRSQRAQVVELPVWIPGSYLVREFAKHLQGLRAWQADRELGVTALDKSRWQLDNRSTAALELHYEVWALDASVRTAWLDRERGFFNGTALLLRPQGFDAVPCVLHVRAPSHAPQWSLATALQPLEVDAQGFGSYGAADYDELVDCPVEMGQLWCGSFSVRGVPHRLVVNGAPAGFDGERLLRDTERICQAQWQFWHPAPSEGGRSKAQKPTFTHYHFLLWAVHEGWGGLEHRHSTALIATRQSLPRLPSPWEAEKKADAPPSEATVRLLGLISHEYFHTWNVKRLRPAEFARYDYGQENYTSLLWFFEGFTSYYDDLLLRRASAVDDACYLDLLAKTLNGVAQTPGQQVQSVAQASFDAWIKYYRPDDNSPNAGVSYYTKGALVALCLDLSLRQAGQGSLDALMRGLWQSCPGGLLREQDVLDAVQERAGATLRAQLQAWVHGTAELPVLELLRAQGIATVQEPVALEQRLGLRMHPGAGLRVRHVFNNSAAERAGLCPGDEWLGVARADAPEQLWRVQQWADLGLYCAHATHIVLLVQRERRLLTLALELPAAQHQWRLKVQDSALAQRWLLDQTP